MLLTHKDFLNALHSNSDDKWVIEEGKNGEAEYYKLSPAEILLSLPGGEGPVTRRNRKAREQMSKKTSKPGRPFIYRVGYNSCTAQWVQGEAVPLFSGSSANRKKPAKKDSTEIKYPYEGPQIHKFSSRSRKKCRDKTMSFFRSIFKDRVFMTLTFIEPISDKGGVQILNKFLTVLRKENKKIEYCWVAEHQPQTGNIHFHCLLNQRLPLRRYNALWVLQQYNAGLRGHTKEGREISYEEMYNAYRCGKMQKLLNPVDLRKAYSIQRLSAYLTAYVTKQKEDEEFGCLTWHCSRKVSKLFTREITGPSTFSYLLKFKYNPRVDIKTGEMFEPDAYHHQFFSTVQVYNKGAPLKKIKTMELVNKWVMEGTDINGPAEIPVVDVDRYRTMFT